MFFCERSTQAESFDEAGRSPEEIASDYRYLGRANRVFFFSHPFVYGLPRLLGRERCRELTLLDVGAGDGSLGRALMQWAARRNWKWKVTNLDLNAHAAKLSPGADNVTGSALALPFPDGHFDVVVASQMTHHLESDEDVARHFQEAWRVAGEGILISDLHRNAGLYAMVWVFARLLGFPRGLVEDGLISVKRGFRVPEWRKLVERAGIPDARVWLYFGTRIMLAARKPGCG